MRHGRGEEAEAALRAAMDWTRRQQAKSWELRAATTLAQLLAERGERAAARKLLAPVFDWFTEGFDTRDLKAALCPKAAAFQSDRAAWRQWPDL